MLELPPKKDRKMSKISKKRSAGNPGFFRTFWGVWNEKKRDNRQRKRDNLEKIGTKT
jgi:hypothetical protein